MNILPRIALATACAFGSPTTAENHIEGFSIKYDACEFLKTESASTVPDTTKFPKVDIVVHYPSNIGIDREDMVDVIYGAMDDLYTKLLQIPLAPKDVENTVTRAVTNRLEDIDGLSVVTTFDGYDSCIMATYQAPDRRHLTFG